MGTTVPRTEIAMTETLHLPTKPVLRNSADCERRWFFGGGVFTWSLTTADTGSTFLLVEVAMEQGKTTPLHTHPADETMYVLEGSIRMHMDGDVLDLEEGGVSMAPRGVAHAFLVTSPVARVLTLHTPGTCEPFYLAASKPYVEGDDHPIDFDRIREAGETTGFMDIVGPPPFTT
jgi:quercetin dioxygenase-like cupin family protein